MVYLESENIIHLFVIRGNSCMLSHDNHSQFTVQVGFCPQDSAFLADKELLLLISVFNLLARQQAIRIPSMHKLLFQVIDICAQTSKIDLLASEVKMESSYKIRNQNLKKKSR